MTSNGEPFLSTCGEETNPPAVLKVVLSARTKPVPSNRAESSSSPQLSYTLNGATGYILKYLDGSPLVTFNTSGYALLTLWN